MTTTTTATVESIKNMIDDLNEDEMVSIVEHIAKKIWIPVYVPRERFDIPQEDFQTLIADMPFGSKINDFVCYLLQNRFENEDKEDKSVSSSSEKEIDAVAEVELESDVNMTVEGLFEQMCQT